MRITKATISNYRNIDGLTVELSSSCSYIVGENNLGKSNLLNLLNTICSGKPFDDDDFRDPGKPIEIVLTIELDQNEENVFGSQFCGEDPSVLTICYRQNITDFIPEAVSLNTDSSIPVNQLRKLNYFKYDSASYAKKEFSQNTRKQLGLLINGLAERFMKQNSTAPLVNVRTMEELAEFVNERFSHIKGFNQYNIVTAVASDTADIVNRLLYLTDGEKRLESTGSGVQYIAAASLGILCYIMGLYKSKSIPFESRLYTSSAGERILPVILAVDEPEVHLHPYLQRSLINFYKRILNNKDNDFRELLKECFDIDGILGQIIIVTHSTDALVGDYRNLVRFFRANGTVSVISGASKDLKITEANEKHLTMHFPELKEAFFSHCVVLIEGATEYGCIQSFAEMLGIPLDDLGICIINADGEGNIEPLRQLLAVFSIPSIAIYDRDVKEKKEKKRKSDRDFFTSEIFFEAEIVRKLYDTHHQQLAKEIATELEGSAMSQIVDENWYHKYISKAGISGEGYVRKRLGEVSLEDEDEFCNVYSAWFTAKKGILLGRIVGEKFTADLIPDCYRDALLKAQEVASRAG